MRVNVNVLLAAVVTENRRFRKVHINNAVGIDDVIGADNNMFVAVETLYTVALRNHSVAEYTPMASGK